MLPALAKAVEHTDMTEKLAEILPTSTVRSKWSTGSSAG